MFTDLIFALMLLFILAAVCVQRWIKAKPAAPINLSPENEKILAQFDSDLMEFVQILNRSAKEETVKQRSPRVSEIQFLIHVFTLISRPAVDKNLVRIRFSRNVRDLDTSLMLRVDYATSTTYRTCGLRPKYSSKIAYDFELLPVQASHACTTIVSSDLYSRISCK